MKIKKNFQRFCITIHALFNRLLRKKYVNRKDVALIVFQQVFGDAVMISTALRGYVELYHDKLGYKVIMLVRPSVAQFMIEVLGVPKEIDIQIVDFKRFLEEYRYYRHIIDKYKYVADTLIVPGTSLSAEIFSSSSTAVRRVGLVRSTSVHWPPIMALFSRLAYTETIIPDDTHMMLQRHRLLLNYLGLSEYTARLPKLLPKEKIIFDKSYCALCPGASKMEKCWPTARYAQIIDYIYEKYHIKTYLCGGIEDLIFEAILKNEVKHERAVVSYIGKTSYSEWSAIVQHAELVLGNDSATMHLAAASCRKAICLAGVYDKYQFFPYKVDELGKTECLPITIYHDMPCEWCRSKGYNSGYKNKKCRMRIKEDKCAVCIELITVKEVTEKIDSLMKDSDVEFA